MRTRKRWGIRRRRGVALAVAFFAAVRWSSDGSERPTLTASPCFRTRVVDVGRNPTAVAVARATRRVFVVSRGPLSPIGNAVGRGLVTVVDPERAAVLRNSHAGIDANAIAVDERARRVFVVNGGRFDARGFQTGRGTVGVYSLPTGRLVRTITVGVAPAAVAVDSAAGRVVVVNRGATPEPGGVSVLDSSTGALVGTVPTGVYASDVAVDTRRHRAYVANLVSNTMSILDVGRGRVSKVVRLGRAPGTAARLVVSVATGRVFALSFPPRISGGGGSKVGRVAVIGATAGRRDGS